MMESRHIKDFPGKSVRVDLLDALYESIQGLIAFHDLIVSDDLNELCIIFKVLLDRGKADLEKVDEVITASLGAIEIEVAGEMIRQAGQTYHKGAFMRAFIMPREEPAEAERGKS